MHRTDKYSQHSSIIWPVWLNGWVFVYELNGCGFESRCSHLNFRYGTCFKQGVSWHSGKHKVWIHSQTRTRNDKNIHSKSWMFLTWPRVGDFICHLLFNTSACCSTILPNLVLIGITGRDTKPLKFINWPSCDAVITCKVSTVDAGLPFYQVWLL